MIGGKLKQKLVIEFLFLTIPLNCLSSQEKNHILQPSSSSPPKNQKKPAVRLESDSAKSAF